MTYSRNPHKKKSDIRVWVALVLLLACIAMLWFLARALFGGPDEVREDIEVPSTLSETSTSPGHREELFHEAEVYAREATIGGVSGYGVTGVAHMRMTFSQYEITMAASLPSIDASVERYEAWLLQPGVADYFSVGSFFPRADGWYGLTYSDYLAHMPPDPQTYTRILITRETQQEDNISSNIRVAEGFFDL